jgi:hypothetical protein
MNTVTSTTNNSKKRVMTSAIPEMTVAEVRKSLGEVRRRAATQTPEQPFFITDSLTPDFTMQQFCLKFVCGHHDKRHNKGKRSKKGVLSEESSSDDE